MPALIIKLQGDLAEMTEQINQDAIEMVKGMDLVRLLEDPDYIQESSREFVQAHMDESQAGFDMGDKFAETVIKNGQANNG